MFAQHLSLQSLENPLMLSSHCPVEIASVGSISGSHLKFREERVRVVRSGLVTPRKNIENCNESVEVCKLQQCSRLQGG